jgi:DNA-binding XRE family transcriptional regulator
MDSADRAIEKEFYAVMGRAIEQKRKARGMSHHDLALMTGLHRNTLYRIESGDGLQIWNLLRIADALSCNHLLLLPAREYTWGSEMPRMIKERHERDAVQFERDPPLTARELKSA